MLLLVHGWPTSSIDWSGVAGPLSERFRVCALDFPGYGFSGKPRAGATASVRDAELLEFYLSQVLGAEAAVVVAHDRGDSVVAGARGPVRRRPGRRRGWSTWS